jgi:FtsZ-binding cell division protein ZapB
VKKFQTLEQVESTKAKAARFVRDVLQDDNRAEEIEDESPQDYAERKRITITNPQRNKTMAAPTRQELLDENEELRNQNQALQDKLDAIADTLNDDDDDSDEDEDEDDDDDEHDDYEDDDEEE